MRPRHWVAAVALVVAGGCGDDPSISDDAAAVLRERVAEIRALAEARDADGAAAKTQELRTAVAALQEAGELDEERAGEVLVAADEVLAQLSLITTTTTTTTTTTSPPRIDEDDEDDEDDE